MVHPKKALYKSALDWEKAKHGLKRHWKERIGTTYDRTRARLIQEDKDWRSRLNPNFRESWHRYVERLQVGSDQLEEDWGSTGKWLQSEDQKRPRFSVDQQELIDLWKRGITPTAAQLKDPECRKKWGLHTAEAVAESLEEAAEGASIDWDDSAEEFDARNTPNNLDSPEPIDLWKQDFDTTALEETPRDLKREKLFRRGSETKQELFRASAGTGVDRKDAPYLPVRGNNHKARQRRQLHFANEPVERAYGGNSARVRALDRTRQREREQSEELSGIKVSSRMEFLQKLRTARDEGEQVKDRTPEEVTESLATTRSRRAARSSSERLDEFLDTLQEHRRSEQRAPSRPSSPKATNTKSAKLSSTKGLVDARPKISLTLERITRLLDVLGNPQDTLKCIHVAGTNGKGSVCAYLTNSLMASGFLTGQFVSPHLIDRWDCITINEQPIPQKEFLALEEEVLRHNTENNFEATSFEALTSIAFTYFARKKVDIAVIETGMGGRLDATNVIKNPLISIITSIALDHAAFLGDDITEIASHKAGIIKPACPVVVSPQRSHVHEIFVEKAKNVQAPFHSALGFWRNSSHQRYFVEDVLFQDVDPLSTPMLGVIPGIAGAEQGRNIACAVKALSLLHKQFPQITEDAVQRGVAKAHLPGRMEWIHLESQEGKVPMLLDGAHNPASLSGLSEFVKTLRGDTTPVVWLVGFSRGRNIESCMSHFIREEDSVACVEFGPVDGMGWVRPVDQDEIEREAQFLTKDYFAEELGNPERIAKFGRNLEAAIRWGVKEAKKRNGVFVATGSLYLVSDIYRLKRDKPQLFGQTALQ